MKFEPKTSVILDKMAMYDARPVVTTVYDTGDCEDSDDALMFELDAIGGTKRDVEINVHQDGASADDVSIAWFITSTDDPTTFAERVIPAIEAVTLAAAGNMYSYFGNLPQGLKLRVYLRAAGNDVADDWFAQLTYLD